MLAPVAGAVVAEATCRFGIRRGWSASARLRAVAAIVPAAMWVGVVVALAVTGGVVWSALVVATTVGALVGVLVTLPAVPQDP